MRRIWIPVAAVCGAAVGSIAFLSYRGAQQERVQPLPPPPVERFAKLTRQEQPVVLGAPEGKRDAPEPKKVVAKRVLGGSKAGGEVGGLLGGNIGAGGTGSLGTGASGNLSGGTVGHAYGYGGLGARGTGAGGGGMGASFDSAGVGGGAVGNIFEDPNSSEGYRNYGVNGFVATGQDKLSTFAVDVDTAS
ncbi:MAG: hypothetical protein HYZ28_21445, partial [Myxococcales bacterium]|nr:hypothetical protein [Myxococcales bacterium]